MGVENEVNANSAPTELELKSELSLAIVVECNLLISSHFTTFPAGGRVGAWVSKMRLMLTQPQTKLELKFELSLAKWLKPRK